MRKNKISQNLKLKDVKFNINFTIKEPIIKHITKNDLYIKKKNEITTLSKTKVFYHFWIFIKFVTVKSTILNINFKELVYKYLIIDNKKNQCRTLLTDLYGFEKCYTNGLILKMAETFKKELKKKNESTLLHIKSIIALINDIFEKEMFVIVIKGTKTNFFRWLNFNTLRLGIPNIVFYIYTPAVPQSPKQYKKIKCIKKNTRKKYFYRARLI